MDNIAIQIDHVSKEYRLGAIGGGTLRGDLQSFMARVRGKDDPNKVIGQKGQRNERFLALDDVSFQVRKGERLGIIGHNGAGKSTLLKLLSRVTAPTKGTIGINGRIASMLEVGTGFHPELTGRENVYMNGAILGMTKAEITRKFDEIVSFAELEQFIDTPVKRYSSGMYVKLAFAVAAHLDSEIMIMDEVLAVGDMKFQQKCLGKMGDVSEGEGRTVLYVSHNMNTIRQLCNRCVVLDKGRVVFQGNVEEAIEVYLNQADELSVTYDYSNVPRSPNETRKLQLLGLDVPNKEVCKVDRTEGLDFVLHCKANENVTNVKIRLEIFCMDGSIIGTTFSDKGISGQHGQYINVAFRLPTKNFAPGKYKAVALAYEFDSYGNQVGVDRVNPALVFEIADEASDSLLWLHQYWGHVRLDDLYIKSIEEVTV